MKHIYLLLLISSFSYSQSSKERKRIAESYNQSEVNQLFVLSKAEEDSQVKIIEEFKKNNPSLDFKNKSLQRIYNGLPIYFTNYNAGSSATIAANSMYPGASLGLNVTGDGMTAGVWDGSRVLDTHVELSGKVTLGDAATGFSSHATHVTGTIIAKGLSTTRRGIAYGALAKTYDWTSDYTEMNAFGAEGYLVSNHSYGYDTTNLPTSIFGSYDNRSIQIDQLSNTYPYYQIVSAAGNDRNNTNLAQVQNKGGYDLMSGFGTSKNGIAVAAVLQVNNYVSNSSVVMSTFSNYGPTDDGRIKPDISAKGVNVSSCSNVGTTQYNILDGTSMASPAITGMIVLLQKHYNNLSSSYMRASTVKGLICHSAREAGNAPGPDYSFGWGLANTEDAAKIISNKGVTSLVEENNIVNSQVFSENILIASPQKVKVTICWTDPVGSVSTEEDNQTARLKNNLDLKLIKDGVVYYPWKLNVNSPTDPATRNSDNEVDNVEKVEIDIADAGVYTIQVSHKGTLVGGAQKFSLIASGAVGVTLSNETFAKNNDIFIYPNPADDTLNFSLANSIQLSDASIFDVTGKKVGSLSDKNATSLDISNLQSGVYFIKFTADNNIVTKKFIKK